MIELVWDLRVINVLDKFENDLWKIMDVRVLMGHVCPPAWATTIPRSPSGLRGKNYLSISQSSYSNDFFFGFVFDILQYHNNGIFRLELTVLSAALLEK